MSEFSKAVVSMPGQERQARTPFGARIVNHATAKETGGSVGMWETYSPPRQGPALHTHTRETEVVRVAKGTYRFRCGDEEFTATPRTVVTLPPNVPHGWQNIGDEMGQMFAIAVPGGCEQLFMDIAESGADTTEKIAVLDARLGIFNETTQALGLNST